MSERDKARHDVNVGYVRADVSLEEFEAQRVRNPDIDEGYFTAVLRLQKLSWHRHQAATYPLRVINAHDAPLDPPFREIDFQLLDGALTPYWQETIGASLQDGRLTSASCFLSKIAVGGQRVIGGFLLDNFGDELSDELAHMISEGLITPEGDHSVPDTPAPSLIAS